VQRPAELWSSHLGMLERREWSALHARLRKRVAADQLPDLLVTLEHPHVDRPAIWARDHRIGLLAGHDRFAIGVDHPASSGTTSVRWETGRRVTLRNVRRALTDSISRAHARASLEVAPEWLGHPAR
jgi:hypothetical protein